MITRRIFLNIVETAGLCTKDSRDLLVFFALESDPESNLYFGSLREIGEAADMDEARLSRALRKLEELDAVVRLAPGVIMLSPELVCEAPAVRENLIRSYNTGISIHSLSIE